jgi:type II secretory pathway component GspD/PulD (secretin)
MNRISAIEAVRLSRGLFRAGSLALVFLVFTAGSASAQLSSASSNGTPILQLIETVSKKTNKSFIVDPHVSGNAILVGIDPDKITYPELLSVLQLHGLAAVENGGIVRVIPDAMVRTTPGPLITGNEKRPDAEFVTRVVRVKSMPAAQLVPILRSLLPQNAHLAAMACTNELIIVDTYANVRRLEGIIAAMDKGDTLALPKCAIPEPAPPQPRSPPAAPTPATPER